ncbi:unnamed protein product [Triticum turgidum subsp. durum]|uniref:Chalcone synthase n=1 Tax=Triticum turgidum subsp. durum TaxID=4567 RepID=A0A9R1BDG8_TRITD|nr:unnamed protein product [Triticum turgidum subsp. durum]
MAEASRISEARRDAVFARWVIFSPARSRRPTDLKSHGPANPSPGPDDGAPKPSCPFCLGRESECAPEIFRVPAPDESLPWRIRVIENLFPALRREAAPPAPEDEEPVGAGECAVRGFGFHDVVIETPHHEVRLWDLDAEGVRDVLLAYARRVQQLAEHPAVNFTEGIVPAATPSVREIWRAQRADGPAAVLAIGTANPAHCVPQDEFPDFYFRATNSDHLTALKGKFKRVFQKLGVEKRYLHHTEELLRAHPEFLDDQAASLDARLDIVATAVPELAAEASKKAIAEWGRPAADITHLVVTTNSGAHIPGVDFRLIPLLGLRPSVRRTMLYMNGCFAGSAALRLAKDLAENNRGARVLVVCAELTLMLFNGPKEGSFERLIHQGLFGDGAGAVIVGADPLGPVEHALFEMVSAAQTVIPDSGDAITMHITKGGRRVLSDYGNMFGVTIIFVLDELRRRLREQEGVGGAPEWGVVMTFGPGLTVETMVLHATGHMHASP